MNSILIYLKIVTNIWTLLEYNPLSWQKTLHFNEKSPIFPYSLVVFGNLCFFNKQHAAIGLLWAHPILHISTIRVKGAPSIIMITQHCVPQNSILQNDCCQNLKFHKNSHLKCTSVYPNRIQRNPDKVFYCIEDKNSQILVTKIPFYLDWLVKKKLLKMDALQTLGWQSWRVIV